jgi:hypothetical protein
MTTPVIVHRREDDRWVLSTHYDLNEAISRGLAALQLHDLDGWINTEKRRADWTADRLQDMGIVFRSPAQTEQIMLASQWLFDSFCGQDVLLSFIQSMVVLEIILGDNATSDQIGLGTLLSNRLAYLIGATHEERERLLSVFKEIYDVRSQIVHRGKHKLSLKEQSLFSSSNGCATASSTRRLSCSRRRSKDRNCSRNTLRLLSNDFLSRHLIQAVPSRLRALPLVMTQIRPLSSERPIPSRQLQRSFACSPSASANVRWIRSRCARPSEGAGRTLGQCLEPGERSGIG